MKEQSTRVDTTKFLYVNVNVSPVKRYFRNRPPKLSLQERLGDTFD